MLVALALLVLLLPFGTGIAAADSGQSNQTQPVALSLTGGVTNAGTQTYELRGGQLSVGIVNGSIINPVTSTLRYSMYSVVQGLNTWGISHLMLREQTIRGQNVYVRAWTFINYALPAAELPFGCSTACTSEIPAMFVGGSVITMSIGGVTQTVQLPVGIESAYLNPFGGNLLISSLDSTTNPTISLIANYTVGNIYWQGVQMAGLGASTFGAGESGNFAMNVNSAENLFSGVEYDHGTIALTGVGPNGQNIQGTFHGISVVPTKGEFPCPYSPTGPNFPPGTCMMTGLNSTGSMNLFSGNYHIVGAYHTVWNIPSVTFTSTVSGTAYPLVHDNGHNSQMENNYDD